MLSGRAVMWQVRQAPGGKVHSCTSWRYVCVCVCKWVKGLRVGGEHSRMYHTIPVEQSVRKCAWVGLEWWKGVARRAGTEDKGEATCPCPWQRSYRYLSGTGTRGLCSCKNKPQGQRDDSLPCKPEDLSLDAQHPCEKWNMLRAHKHSSARAETGQFLGAE